MTIIIILLVIIILVYGPQLWVRWVMKWYGHEIQNMPGTGEELAKHLVEKLDLSGITIEETSQWGDHYDPRDKVVRLSPTNFSGKSLTAIAVATHEIGHAMQDHEKNKWMQRRATLYPLIQTIEKIAVIVLSAAPVVGLIFRAPIISVVMIIAGLTFFLGRVIFHGVTLPLELDASFNKALPILQQGGYVPVAKQAAVRRILRAAALTYIASALADMLSIWRWVIILRGRWI